MLKRLTIRLKLMMLLGLALAVILGLSGITVWTLQGNMQTSRMVKDKTYKIVGATETLVAAAKSIISYVDASASQNSEEGLVKAKAAVDAIQQELKGIQPLIDEKALLEKYRRLSKMTDEVYAAGAERVKKVVEQDFVGIASSLQAFNEKAEAYGKLLAEVNVEAEHRLSSAITDIETSSRIALRISGVLAAFGAGMLLFLGAVIFRSITKPIAVTVNMLRDIAEGEGDLTKRLEVASRDEIGELAKWFNLFVSKNQQIIQGIGKTAERLNGASGELTTISSHMADGAGQTASLSDTVAASSEEMSSNISTVAATMEEAAGNLEQVASAAEQIAASIGEIAKNSETAKTKTSGAAGQARNSSEKMAGLGKAAQEISKVTETITEISEQTNLLALNATIEAARAGEAGKGFAVVANEIKELARQTAEATGEIKKQIEGIQHATTGMIEDIEQIPKVISDVEDIVATIAAAVEEQSVTTKEIASNVAQASRGIQEVNQNVSQSSSVAGEIAKDIAEVNTAAGDITNSSSQVSLSAQELKRLAGELEQMVGQFKV